MSSHLEKHDGIVYIVGNNTRRQRVATGDEIELHLALGQTLGSLEAVLSPEGNRPEVKARAQRVLEATLGREPRREVEAEAAGEAPT